MDTSQSSVYFYTLGPGCRCMLNEKGYKCAHSQFLVNVVKMTRLHDACLLAAQWTWLYRW